jgi:hypothetical protein
MKCPSSGAALTPSLEFSGLGNCVPVLFDWAGSRGRYCGLGQGRFLTAAAISDSLETACLGQSAAGSRTGCSTSGTRNAKMIYHKTLNIVTQTGVDECSLQPFLVSRSINTQVLKTVRAFNVPKLQNNSAKQI